MKTDIQINAEVVELRACKLYVPKRTLFGDDNHAKIDAQIRVLTEKMDEDDCSKFLDEGELGEDGEPDSAAFEIESCARDAAKWLHDEKDAKAPHLDWEHLKKVGKSAALSAGYGLGKPVKGDPYKVVAKAMGMKKNTKKSAKRK